MKRGLACLMIVLIGLSGCSSAPVTNAPKDQNSDENDDIARYSDGEAYYAGLYNTFIYRATLLNAPVRAELLRKLSDFYQWDREKFTAEREKSDREYNQETTVFLSFYTPDRRNDNLSEDKSIWRIYLEVGGHRYLGKAKKLRTSLAELAALYPQHTRWNTPYEVTFPVPTSAVETQASQLTVTGPLGNKIAKFPAVR